MQASGQLTGKETFFFYVRADKQNISWKSGIPYEQDKLSDGVKCTAAKGRQEIKTNNFNKISVDAFLNGPVQVALEACAETP